MTRTGKIGKLINDAGYQLDVSALRCTLNAVKRMRRRDDDDKIDCNIARSEEGKGRGEERREAKTESAEIKRVSEGSEVEARAGSGNCYLPGNTLSPPPPRMMDGERTYTYAKRELIKSKGEDALRGCGVRTA